MSKGVINSKATPWTYQDFVDYKNENKGSRDEPVEYLEKKQSNNRIEKMRYAIMGNYIAR